MKSFDKFCGDPAADAQVIAEAIYRNTNDDRLMTTLGLLTHWHGILANKSNLSSLEITMQDVSNMQATYLRDQNHRHDKPGYRMRDAMGKANAEHVPVLITTILPVSVHFDKGGFRLDFGQTGDRKGTLPVFRNQYKFDQAKYALYEWYKATKAIQPLSAVNEYCFSVTAAILFAQIKRMMQR